MSTCFVRDLDCHSPLSGRNHNIRIVIPTIQVQGKYCIVMQVEDSITELDRETALAVAVALNDAVAEYDRMSAQRKDG